MKQWALALGGVCRTSTRVTVTGCGWRGRGSSQSGSAYEQGCPLSPLLFNIFMARQVIQACEAKGVHGFKVAFRISVQVVNSKTG